MPTAEQYRAEVEILPSTAPVVPSPKFSPDGFFEQRDRQRRNLFRFALLMSILSLVFLFGIVVWQTLLRVYVSQYFEVISDQGLEIIAAAVFGQIFGVVYVIAHALWSNDEFGYLLARDGKK